MQFYLQLFFFSAKKLNIYLFISGVYKLHITAFIFTTFCETETAHTGERNENINKKQRFEWIVLFHNLNRVNEKKRERKTITERHPREHRT